LTGEQKAAILTFRVSGFALANPEGKRFSGLLLASLREEAVYLQTLT